MDIGRWQNADPRWILPLLCRRGHITRNEIGAIRISANETHFQVPRAIADRFAAALVRTADTEDEGGVHIEAAPDTPRDAARQRRRGADAPGHPAPERRQPREARRNHRESNDEHPRKHSKPKPKPKDPAAAKARHKKPHRKGPKGPRG